MKQFTEDGYTNIRNIKKSLQRLKEKGEILSYTAKKHPKEPLLKVYMTFFYKKKTLELNHFLNVNRTTKEWLSDLYNLINNRKRGLDTEIRMFNLLSIWKQTHAYGVLDVYWANEYFDKTRKADIVVVIGKTLKAHNSFQERAERFIIPLQIKSSKTGQDRHKKSNPNEPSIVVSEHTSDEDIAYRFKKLVSAAIVCQIMGLAIDLFADQKDGSNTLFAQRAKQVYQMKTHI